MVFADVVNFYWDFHGDRLLVQGQEVLVLKNDNEKRVQLYQRLAST